MLVWQAFQREGKAFVHLKGRVFLFYFIFKKKIIKMVWGVIGVVKLKTACWPDLERYFGVWRKTWWMGWFTWSWRIKAAAVMNTSTKTSYTYSYHRRSKDHRIQNLYFTVLWGNFSMYLTSLSANPRAWTPAIFSVSYPKYTSNVYTYPCLVAWISLYI